MLLINAIHWFNPLAYIARRDIERFCELSCDESVVRSMNNEERSRYCQLILSVLWQIANHRSTLSSAFSDKHKQLERRIDLIMNFEALKNKKWVRIFAISMTLALLFTGSVIAYTEMEQTETADDHSVDSQILDRYLISDLKVSTEILTGENDADLITLEGRKSYSDIVPFVTGSLRVGRIYSGNSYYIGVGSTIATSATWTPTSQSLDVGYVINGVFRFVRFSGGSGSHTFTVNEEGNAQIRVRNPSINTATVNFSLDYVVD